MNLRIQSSDEDGADEETTGEASSSWDIRAQYIAHYLEGQHRILRETLEELQEVIEQAEEEEGEEGESSDGEGDEDNYDEGEDVEQGESEEVEEEG